MSDNFSRSQEEVWSGVPESGSSKTRLQKAEINFYKNPDLDSFRNLVQFKGEYFESLALESGPESSHKWSLKLEDSNRQDLRDIDAVASGEATQNQIFNVLRELTWAQYDIDPERSRPNYYDGAFDLKVARDKLGQLIKLVAKDLQVF